MTEKTLQYGYSATVGVAYDKAVALTREALAATGFGVLTEIDVKATLFDGSFHEVDSSEIAFKIAASMAFKDGVMKARPAILEPMMKVEVVLPDEYVGDVIGDLASRRAKIEGMETQAGVHSVIRAKVPLADMFGYATAVRSLTQGRGTFTMEFFQYEEVPKTVAEGIIAKSKGE